MGGAIVSGSFQGFDQTYLLDSLEKLGSSYVGVAQLPYTTSDEELMYLNQKGVKAIRFNAQRGGSEALSHLEYLSRRVYDLLGWHTELYIDAKHLSEIAPVIIGLPSVSIDHLGLSKEGFDVLISLVEKGVRVKATGFGRVDFDVKEAIRTLSSANPHALMFGTDLPSTRAPRPFEDTDIQITYDALEDGQAKRVLYQNAMEWYHVS